MRDAGTLADREFDLVVVGGGIFGAWATLEAARAGLRVALLEQSDYGSGTSANPYKIAHGGIRYLQHLDFKRIRHSSAERSGLLRTAPHLVRPLPIVVPTFGYGRKSRWFLRSGTRVYDVLTRARNEGIPDPSRRIPDCSSLDREEITATFPGLRQDGLTGGVRFHDGQIHSPPRLIWCVLRSALEAGASLCNYVSVLGVEQDGSRVSGVRARDKLTGEEFGIRSRFVLNSAGAWTERLIQSSLGRPLSPPSAFSRDLCFVLHRPWNTADGLAVSAQTHDPGAVLSRGARHLFLVPWRGLTLVGVWHSVRTEAPEQVDATWEEIDGYLDELNAGYEGQGYTRDDVSLVNFGLVLFGRNEEGAVNLRYGSRSRFIDHGKEHGIEGLHSLIGVRYTTGHADGAEAVRRICAQFGNGRAAPDMLDQPVWGGDFDSFEGLVEAIRGSLPTDVEATEESLRSIAHHHGSAYMELVGTARSVPHGFESIAATHVWRAEVVHAAREEHAVHLDDVVFRRTELGTASDPGEAAVQESAELMAIELGWDDNRRAEEVARVDATPRRHLARR